MFKTGLSLFYICDILKPHLDNKNPSVNLPVGNSSRHIKDYMQSET